MPSKYGSYEFKPTESVSFSTVKHTSGDGRLVGQSVRAVLQANIVPDNPAGTFTPISSDARLSTILARQADIRAALATDGLLFETDGWDGSHQAKFQAKVIEGPTFEPGPWTNECKYSVTFEGTDFAGDSARGYHVESASESWNFSTDAWPNRAVHSVQAKGLSVYNDSGALTQPAWQNARDFVNGQLALGWTSVGSGFSPSSGQTILTGGTARPGPTGAWNRSVTEDINETDGTYAATETWLLVDASYYEEWSLTVRHPDGEPLTTVEVSLTGTVSGYSAATNDYDTRYANALSGWATIASGLKARADAASGLTLHTHPVVYSVTQARIPGTVSYEVAYNNRAVVSDTIEAFTVDWKRSADGAAAEVTVQGTITGLLYPDTETDPALRLTRAKTRWATVSGLLYGRATAATGLSGLQALPVSHQYAEDAYRGVITYAYEYDDRPSNLARLDVTVSRKDSREDPVNIVSLEGTITGLGDTYASRYDNALAYWGGLSMSLFSLAGTYVDTSDINTETWNQTVGHNPRAGTVSFHAEFNTRRHATSGVLSEAFTLTDTHAVAVIATIPVLGRSGGPVIQSMGTVTAKERTVSVELVYPAPSSAGFTEPPDVSLDSYAPSGSVVVKTADTTNWQWSTGRLSRQANWVVSV